MSWPGHTQRGPQAAPQWVPGTKVDSVVPPPRWVVERDALHATKFTREEAEVFITYTESHKRPGEPLGDRMLDWASCPQYKAENVRSRKIRHLVKRAVDEFIPEDVERADFTEKLDGAQTLVFFFRCLYDAIKELLRNARFSGRQYTQADVVLNAAGHRMYSAFNTGTVYEVAQLRCGPNCSPVPIFLSSDGTVIGKSMAGHPIICECPTQPPQYCRAAAREYA